MLKYPIFGSPSTFNTLKKFVTTYINSDTPYLMEVIFIYWTGKLIILSSRLNDVGKWRVGYGCLRTKCLKQACHPQRAQQERIMLIWKFWRSLHSMKLLSPVLLLMNTVSSNNFLSMFRLNLENLKLTSLRLMQIMRSWNTPTMSYRSISLFKRRYGFKFFHCHKCHDHFW